MVRQRCGCAPPHGALRQGDEDHGCHITEDMRGLRHSTVAAEAAGPELGAASDAAVAAGLVGMTGWAVLLVRTIPINVIEMHSQ